MVVAATSITFNNLTSLDSEFTNTNATSNATANFVGLGIDLIIRNVNTSVDLFTSVALNQNFNATFTPGQVLRIVGVTASCDPAVKSLLTVAILLFVLGIIGLPLFMIINRGVLIENLSPKKMAQIFAALMVGISLLVLSVNGIKALCG